MLTFTLAMANVLAEITWTATQTSTAVRSVTLTDVITIHVDPDDVTPLAQAIADGYEPRRGAPPVRVITETSARTRARMIVNGVSVVVESDSPPNNQN